MTHLTECIADALVRRHLRRCFQYNINQTKSGSQSVIAIAPPPLLNIHISKTETKNYYGKPWPGYPRQIDSKICTKGKTSDYTHAHLVRGLAEKNSSAETAYLHTDGDEQAKPAFDCSQLPHSRYHVDCGNKIGSRQK